MAHEANRHAEAILDLVHDVGRIGDFSAPLKKDCTDLARRIALLSHLLEEIKDFKPSPSPSSSPSSSSSSSSSSPSSTLPCPPSSSSLCSCLNELGMAILAGKRLLLIARSVGTVIHDSAGKRIGLQFQYVTWHLERILGSLPFDYFDISDEVREQVELVRAQLRRAAERNSPPNSKAFAVISSIFSPTFADGVDQDVLGRAIAGLQTENIGIADPEFRAVVDMVSEIYCHSKHELETVRSTLGNLSNPAPYEADQVTESEEIPNALSDNNLEEIRKPDSDSQLIPNDLRCPISLELMKDPVIVATGQTYERSFIQRWIDCGNRTCPITQQKLTNLTLTPNHVLRSVISQWCEAHNVQPPEGSAKSRLRNNNRPCQQVSGDRAAIETLVCKLSSQSYEERRNAAAEIRSLAKRNTDNRMMIAESGAIPILVNLLQTDDLRMQENAVTALLNLSIYESNKAAIMLAGAVPPIVGILRRGSMEARENAAATLFSLSMVDENKITIGASGAIKALVELLRNGSSRGKKDAATALFNLSIYQSNKVRAVKAGILVPLMKMLTDASECMVDEALTILSILASNQDCKEAIAKANAIPLLIDLLRTGQPRNKENAAAILLWLCKKDRENLACIGRLGALIPLTELTRSGTDRAKRKATSLLEHLNRMQQQSRV